MAATLSLPNYDVLSTGNNCTAERSIKNETTTTITFDGNGTNDINIASFNATLEKLIKNEKRLYNFTIKRVACFKRTELLFLLFQSIYFISLLCVSKKRLKWFFLFPLNFFL